MAGSELQVTRSKNILLSFCFLLLATCASRFEAFEAMRQALCQMRDFDALNLDAWSFILFTLRYAPCALLFALFHTEDDLT